MFHESRYLFTIVNTSRGETLISDSCLRRQPNPPPSLTFDRTVQNEMTPEGLEVPSVKLTRGDLVGRTLLHSRVIDRMQHPSFQPDLCQFQRTKF